MIYAERDFDRNPNWYIILRNSMYPILCRFGKYSSTSASLLLGTNVFDVIFYFSIYTYY